MMHRPARHKWAARAAGVGIFIALAAVSLCIYWLVYPYDDFTIDPGPYPLTNVTERQNGLPVLDQGDVLSFTLADLCNRGVDVVSIRWFDLYDYDKYLFFEPGSLPSASISAPPREFYEATTTPPPCPSDVPVTVKVPNYIEHGFVYRFRFEMTYKPNPIRTITQTVTTERFAIQAGGLG